MLSDGDGDSKFPSWQASLVGESAVLQTLPRNAVTSANAVGTPGLRTYLAHDESRRYRGIRPLSHRSTTAAGPILLTQGGAVAQVTLFG